MRDNQDVNKYIAGVTSFGRVGLPDDIGPVVAFLCSEEEGGLSISTNSSDTSISRSTQLDYAIPAPEIASLSSGEFVGMVADDPTNKIELKTFYCQIQNDHEAIAFEERGYLDIP